MKRAVLLGIGLAAIAGCCPPKPATLTPPGGGSGGAGSGSAITSTGTGGGSDAGSAAAPPALVPWDKAGVTWSEPPAPGAEPSFTPPAPVEWKLANGVRVLLVENHRLPLVSLRVIHHRAGSREDAGKVGLAALTGDLLDEGAGAWTSLTLPEELERLGADLSIGVGADEAVVSVDSLAETLEGTLGVLASVLTQPTFTKADFERVKGDRIAELKLRPDSPRKVATLVFEQTVFPKHPYGSPGTGFVASVKKLALADVKAFWKAHYAPSVATLIVAGDIDRARLEPMLARTIGTWKGKPLPPSKMPAPPLSSKPHLVFVDRPEAPQSVVMIGRLGPTVGDRSYFPAEVSNTALGGSFASRLNNRLREQLGYTYGIFSAYWRGQWGGTWSVVSSMKTANTIDGIKEALAIIDRTRKDELPGEELAKAKQLLTRAQPQDFETNDGIAGVYQGVIVAHRPLDWPRTWAAAVRAVPATEARQVADKAWSNLAIVVVGDWKALAQGLGGMGLPITHLDAEGKPVKR